jgi:nucleoside-diphosphate-sugar epimerase
MHGCQRSNARVASVATDTRTLGKATESAHRVVVSGISGLVGRELAHQLAVAGVDVLGLTRRELSTIAPFSFPVRLYRLDGNTQYLVDLFQDMRPDTVIHLAAQAQRNHSTADVRAFIEANSLVGTQLLEAARLSDCRRFITAESILQFSDTGKYQPYNLYAATKQAFADLLLYYTDAFDISAIALVLPTIYSEYETLPKLMTDITSSVLNNSVLNLYTDDVQIDFMHVEDIARAFVRAAALLDNPADAKKGSLTRYCVSSGADITPPELVGLFEQIAEKKITVQRHPLQATTRRVRPWRGPILPGWSPQINLETGIKRMLSRPR